jgi:hypothetical protein
MKPLRDPDLLLTDTLVDRVVALIRADPVLGQGSFSSWEEVAPTHFEACERVRSLVEDGVVRIVGVPTPRSIVRALREAEKGFWGTAD